MSGAYHAPVHEHQNIKERIRLRAVAGVKPYHVEERVGQGEDGIKRMAKQELPDGGNGIGEGDERNGGNENGEHPDEHYHEVLADKYHGLRIPLFYLQAL